MQASAPRTKQGTLRLLHPLGKGGWGEVFLAERDEQKIAAKFLHPGLGPQALEFFKNEVRLLSHLSHPHLVKIYDFYSEGSSPKLSSPNNKNLLGKLAQRPFFTMEFLEGVSLEQVPCPQNFSQILPLFAQIGQGLHYLHSRNILHRDLKPSNIHVTPSGQAKILDFNLSTVVSASNKSEAPVGTLPFMAPEIFRGEYSASSDLFSWGVVFYQWLTGKLPYSKPASDPQALRIPPAPLQTLRPDLPDFFCRLIHRLLEFAPSARPSSALAALKYLNQHLPTPLPLDSEQTTETVLERIPLVGREKIFDQIFALEKSLKPQGPPILIHLHGPMGVGRSRLLEELKWRYQLEGKAFVHSSAAASESWMLGLDENARDPRTLLERLQTQGASQTRVLVYSDLQDWQETDLKDLNLFLHLAARRHLPWLIFLESRDEGEEEGLRNLLHSLGEADLLHRLPLRDLSPQESRELIALAYPEAKLGTNQIDRMVEDSGGRPLLLLEALRQELTGSQEIIRANWKDLATAQIGRLSAPARQWLSLIVAHSLPAAPQELAELSGQGSQAWEEILLELDEKGFLLPRHPAEPFLKLAHPGLKDVFRQSLAPELSRDAHRLWLEFLKNQAGEAPEAKRYAPLLAEHAWALQERDELKKWGLKAAEFYNQSARWPQSLQWLERLLPFAEAGQEQVIINAHLAPLYFRLGNFSESLKAYERWISQREDDESRLQRLKYEYYAGFVNFTWGRFPEAFRHIREALKTGDGQKYPAHRPYLARAHSTLAALLDKEGKISEGRKHLEIALPLAEGDSLLKGEVEQCWGNLERQDLNFTSALEHFERAREYYHAAKNTPAEAQALHSAGQILQEAGDLRRAEAALEASERLALQSSDLLQWARFTENKAMLWIDRALYRRAKQEMEKAGEVLEMLAKPEDRALMELHRAVLYLYTGNWDRVAQIFEKLENESSGQSSSFKTRRDLWRAEWNYLRGDYAEAAKRFQNLAETSSGESFSLSHRRAWLGLTRCRIRQPNPEPQATFLKKMLSYLEILPYPAFGPWKDFLECLLRPTEQWDETRLGSLLSKIRGSPFPEFKAEAFALLAIELRRRGLESTARYVEKERVFELMKIYENLSEEDQMDFEKNRDLKNLDRVLQETLSKEKEPSTSHSPPVSQSLQSPPPSIPPSGGTVISEGRFRQYSQINRYISQNRPLEDILERVMDAAIELTGAERGFLLLQSPKAKEGPLKGFEVKTARHLSQRSLAQKEFQFSLSAVKQVMEQGTYLLSDNAQLDERLQAQKSVVLFQLKSILALPLEAEDHIVGAIYLDHPYRQACFSEENVVLLSALAGQAALAIQKAQLLEDLKRSQEKLKAQVQDQAEKLEAMSEELSQFRSSLRYGYEEIIGQSPAMMKVFDLLDHVTETAIPVWILGESGTGKELIARSLHENSPRKKFSFVAENCSAIPENLLESELFGHKRGAFTHADRDRVGLLEQASGGTLFLDEVADMSLGMQAKLLRVLQEGEVRPLGSNKTIKIDVRLVTASNRDLKQLVQEGKFRQDLFFRINGLTVRLPPLRERKEDILLLAQHFIKNFSRDLNLKPAELSDAALQLLLRHPWQGNIRELEGVLRTALLFAKGRTIQPAHLQLGFTPSAPAASEAGSSAGRRSTQEEESEERQMILEALKQSKLSKEGAAKKLGMGLRTLYTRMGILGIPKKKTLLAKYLGS